MTGGPVVRVRIMFNGEQRHLELLCDDVALKATTLAWGVGDPEPRRLSATTLDGVVGALLTMHAQGFFKAEEDVALTTQTNESVGNPQDQAPPDQSIKKGLDADVAAKEKQIETLKNSLAAQNVLLDQIAFDDTRYYWIDNFTKDPVIQFTITNKGTIPVRKIYVQGVLDSAGRSIPWVNEAFNYDLIGGLEPGETRELKLSPNQFGPWGDAMLQSRDDLRLSLTLSSFEGPDGVVYERAADDELSKLQHQLGELKARLAAE